MQDYGHVLCLFCKTGKEQSVAHRISENGVGTAIFPQRIAKRYSKERKAYEEIRTALLPGYVFVYLPDEVPPVNWNGPITSGMPMGLDAAVATAEPMAWRRSVRSASVTSYP